MLSAWSSISFLTSTTDSCDNLGLVTWRTLPTAFDVSIISYRKFIECIITPNFLFVNTFKKLIFGAQTQIRTGEKRICNPPQQTTLPFVLFQNFQVVKETVCAYYNSIKTICKHIFNFYFKRLICLLDGVYSTLITKSCQHHFQFFLKSFSEYPDSPPQHDKQPHL